jgi:hypothetical protein
MRRVPPKISTEFFAMFRRQSTLKDKELSTGPSELSVVPPDRGRPHVVRPFPGDGRNIMSGVMRQNRWLTIGRDPKCDIAIADESVSRMHAELTLREDGSILVRDCGSRNGTRILRRGAFQPVSETPAVQSDTLQFGSVSLPVADVLRMLRARGLNNKAADAAPSAAVGRTKLERCACGAIKPVLQRCPECNQ